MIPFTPDYLQVGHLRLPVVADVHKVKSPIPLHAHKYTEISIVLQGTGEHCSPLGMHSIKRGDVLLIRPGGWHSVQDPDQLILYNCLIAQDILSQELAGFAKNPTLAHLVASHPQLLQHHNVMEGHLTEEAFATCHQHLDMIYQLTQRFTDTLSYFPGYVPSYPMREMPTDVAGVSVQCIAHLILFLIEAVKGLPQGKLMQDGRNSFHEAVQEALRLFTEQPAHAWTVGELASRLHLDPSYLMRLFKQSTGLSLMAYLSQYRAEQAARLLVTTDHTISDIGGEVGWADPGHFAEKFKSHFGVSPRSYRIRFKRQQIAF
jgi:AraC family L-rhamnose operon transcriptional activator RhaR